MFKLNAPFPIIYLAAAAVLAAAFACGFIIRLVCPKRSRKGGDAVVLWLSSICIVLLALFGVCTVLCSHTIFGLHLGNDAGALVLLLNGKAVFGLPKVGFVADYLASLLLAGQIIPFGVAAIALLFTVTLGAKTKRVRRVRKVAGEQVAAVPSSEQSLPTSENSEIEDIDFAVSSDEPSVSGGLDGSDSVLDDRDVAETALSDNLSQETKPAVERGAKSLMSEIDRLVTQAREQTFSAEDTPESDQIRNVNRELERAIREAMALKEQYAAGQQEESSDDGAALSDENEEDARIAAEVLAEEEAAEQTAGSMSEQEDAASTETAETDGLHTVVDAQPMHRVSPSAKEPIETGFEQAPPTTDDYNDIILRAKTRTIIRRPPVRPVIDLVQSTADTAETSEKKPMAKPSEKTSGKKKTAAEETAATNVSVQKDVTPLEGGLPLTRKYIILNRRSAANVFSEYLRQKAESQKDELTESLNTIILK